MEYEKLSRLFYKLDSKAYNEELEKRKQSYGSYQTPFTIRAFRKGKLDSDSFDAFYVTIPKLMNLNNEVLKNSSIITGLISKLPDFVIEPYFQKLIINEAQSNNEIEGVRSTKKELSEVLSRLDEPKSKRFKGMMKTYLHIESIKPFQTAEDFRKLYDDLVADEIDKKNAPDGTLFRTGYVEVNDGANVTHIGLSSEDKITRALEKLIDYLSSNAHPELYRYMVAHYYYEYVHPFYDGNGRTGRLFVCSYLSRYLERYSGITFSYAINKNKQKYYKALEEIPNPMNKGEMTFYLIDMLELLVDGQKDIIDDLELNLIKMKKINEFFKGPQWVSRRLESQFLKAITLITVFKIPNATITLESMMQITRYSRYKTDKMMNRFIEDNYVELVSNRPKRYRLRDEFLNQTLDLDKGT
ncbi:Fic family protein [Cohnella panacarvi]|uniref:Fic family protein n=1 Tax=Cohnella panacarvi TaxID=400776 RepID=UPI00047A913C|nr:Fic family protein [Cohnella panacarvi]